MDCPCKFLFLYRRRAGHRAAYVTGNRLGEVGWLLVPCFIVLLLDLWIVILAQLVG